jgi:NADP-dependent 3-hydroxy acid dehydrogenase YdfG
VDPFSVDGKAVVVTGGGTGIGAAIAREFASRGARILIASRSAEHLDPVAAALRTAGGTIESIVCDVRDAAQVDAMIERAWSAFGALDVLINNHGASFYLTPNGFGTIVAINLNGTFLCSRAAARRWIDRKTGGRIINLSSEAGVYGAPGMCHYAAAKAGVQNLTRTLAMEWAQYGILRDRSTRRRRGHARGRRRRSARWSSARRRSTGWGASRRSPGPVSSSRPRRGRSSPGRRSRSTAARRRVSSSSSTQDDRAAASG